MLMRQHALSRLSTSTIIRGSQSGLRRISCRSKKELGCRKDKNTFPSSQTSWSRQQSRQYALVAEKQPSFAILGGGITGLASAYFLTQEFPNAKVTVFESKEELGGWVKSEKINVGNGEVLFESGPRSLRPAPPAGTLTLRLIQELGLVDDVLATPKTAPAAQNRFMYYPDHLVRMPGPGQSFGNIARSLMFEPAFKGLFRGVFNDLMTDKRPDHLVDESVGSFISRRFSPHLADNLASGLFHGIYAGDIYQLSAKSILPIPWMREGKHSNLSEATWQAAIQRTSWNFCDDMELQMKLQDTQWERKLEEQVANCSVFTFKRGLGQLSEQLERRLSYKQNVKLLKSTEITSVTKEQGTSALKLSSRPSKAQSNPPETTTTPYTHVISTLPSSTTYSLFSTASTPAPTSLSHRPLSSTLTSTPAVNVGVVNLYFRTPSLLHTITPPAGLPNGTTQLEGFGYLIPRSVPFSENPERALGVIFDSDISPNLSTTVPQDRLGTRLTVMLGGHWWDGWNELPGELELQEMALNVLARHLGIVEEPAAVRATLQRQCIPQYTVGHSQRMGEAHQGLLDAFDGRVRVAGSWYHGVGVNDCLRSAYEVVQGLSKEVNKGELGRNASGVRERRTGLERFAWGRPLALVKREKSGELEVVAIEEAAVKQGFFEGQAVERREA